MPQLNHEKCHISLSLSLFFSHTYWLGYQFRKDTKYSVAPPIPSRAIGTYAPSDLRAYLNAQTRTHTHVHHTYKHAYIHDMHAQLHRWWARLVLYAHAAFARDGGHGEPRGRASAAAHGSCRRGPYSRLCLCTTRVKPAGRATNACAPAAWAGEAAVHQQVRTCFSHQEHMQDRGWECGSDLLPAPRVYLSIVLFCSCTFHFPVPCDNEWLFIFELDGKWPSWTQVFNSMTSWAKTVLLDAFPRVFERHDSTALACNVWESGDFSCTTWLYIMKPGLMTSPWLAGSQFTLSVLDASSRSVYEYHWMLQPLAVLASLACASLCKLPSWCSSQSVPCARGTSNWGAPKWIWSRRLRARMQAPTWIWSTHADIPRTDMDLEHVSRHTKLTTPLLCASHLYQTHHTPAVRIPRPPASQLLLFVHLCGAAESLSLTRKTPRRSWSACGHKRQQPGWAHTRMRTHTHAFTRTQCKDMTAGSCCLTWRLDTSHPMPAHAYAPSLSHACIRSLMHSAPQPYLLCISSSYMHPLTPSLTHAHSHTHTCAYIQPPSISSPAHTHAHTRARTYVYTHACPLPPPLPRTHMHA